jgi:aminopeptidase N
MLELLIGAADFRAGMDLYFERWDGQATTVEAFIACFAEVSGRDLGDFFRWYEQAGTPVVGIQATYDRAAQALDLTFRQSTAPTPEQPEKSALPIPIAFGLLGQDGEVLRETQVLILDEAERTLRLEGVAETPVLSALRGFSAPVTLVTDAPARDAYALLAGDPDLFNRWEAGQSLARDLILCRAQGRPDEVGEERYAEAVGRALEDQAAEPAFKALLLGLPTEPDLAVLAAPADPAAIHAARDALRARIALHLGPALRRLHGGLQEAGAFSVDAEAAGRRALRNAALDMLAADPHVLNRERAKGHFDAAANMTDAMGGLNALIQMGGEAAEAALAAFYERWKDDPLVIDKWFAVQARDPSPGALGRVLGLTAHPAFDPRNPNRLRSLVAVFAAFNPARFHDPSGAGYRFLADQVLIADAVNPNIAARLVEPLGAWARYAPALGVLMRGQLERIAGAASLSANVRELVVKALG